jgi:hypothetical protein
LDHSCYSILCLVWWHYPLHLTQILYLIPHGDFVIQYLLVGGQHCYQHVNITWETITTLIRYFKIIEVKIQIVYKELDL